MPAEPDPSQAGWPGASWGPTEHPEDGAVLTPDTSWGSEDDPDVPPPPGLLARYRPPFTFLSDHLFVVGFCPVEPLRRVFPLVPFVSLAGQTPLVAWLSRVREGCAGSDGSGWRCEGGAGEVLYHEVTVIAPLWRRAFFVPGIYATSRRSAVIARHYYAMPKETVSLSLWTGGDRFAARTTDGVCRSGVRARLIGSGRFLGRLLRPFWPLSVWPVLFPAGTQVEGTIDSAARVQPAIVTEGRLAVDAPWLPRAVGLLPLGLYVSGLKMRLLPPR